MRRSNRQVAQAIAVEIAYGDCVGTDGTGAGPSDTGEPDTLGKGIQHELLRLHCRSVVKDVSDTYESGGPEISHEKIVHVVAVEVQAADHFLTENDIRNCPLDDRVGAGKVGKVQIRAVPGLGRKIIIPGDVDGPVHGASAGSRGRSPGRLDRSSSPIERGGGQHFSSTVSVQVGNHAGGTRVVSLRPRRRDDPSEVTLESGIVQLDLPGGPQVVSSTDDIDRTAVEGDGLASFVFLVGSDYDVGDSVTIHISHSHPHSKSVTAISTDDREYGQFRRRLTEIEKLQTGCERSYLGASHDHGKRSRSDSAEWTGRVVLASHQKIGNPVAADVIDPDLIPRGLSCDIACDPQEGGLISGGINGPADVTLTEDKIHFPRAASAERAGPHEGNSQICIAVSVHVTRACYREA